VTFGRVAVACTSKVLLYPVDLRLQQSQSSLVAGHFVYPRYGHADQLMKSRSLAGGGATQVATAARRSMVKLGGASSGLPRRKIVSNGCRTADGILEVGVCGRRTGGE